MNADERGSDLRSSAFICGFISFYQQLADKPSKHLKEENNRLP